MRAWLIRLLSGAVCLAGALVVGMGVAHALTKQARPAAPTLAAQVPVGDPWEGAAVVEARDLDPTERDRLGLETGDAPGPGGPRPWLLGIDDPARAPRPGPRQSCPGPHRHRPG